MKTSKKAVASTARFRAGAGGACESQLWLFSASLETSKSDEVPARHWVAAESLEEAVRYMRQRHGGFFITKARFAGIVTLLSGAPFD